MIKLFVWLGLLAAASSEFCLNAFFVCLFGWSLLFLGIRRAGRLGELIYTGSYVLV